MFLGEDFDTQEWEVSLTLGKEWEEGEEGSTKRKNGA